MKLIKRLAKRNQPLFILMDHIHGKFQIFVLKSISISALGHNTVELGGGIRPTVAGC